ncbi:MAG: methylenetetrahydrofolate--tRNA-(uracil(54)-C(5))-methyltransferase (FADH(2)-oxidizing) TrmFO [Christensenella sp.]|nr:methylenetetrahydrofolate--tRNA-(uracil(54)-C(5))-methyltransferase (FADH(2)-oxidizing) TrmFO [Christensenella sp.]
MIEKVRVIGGGLAGCEASLQLLKRGYSVELYEMRGVKNTPCHKTTNLAELVCSNSLKSVNEDTGHGLLKLELEKLDCELLKCAYKARVPAGGALAVDRDLFSKYVEEKLYAYDNFSKVNKEYVEIDSSIPTIIATGPLTSDELSKNISKLLGEEYLNFYDAVAPIISKDSINMDKAFFAARYDKGGDDYINCPMNKEEYLNFYNALINAERATLHDFDINVFENCMPIEIMASRGEDTMRFGPLRPKGIRRPGSDERFYAVVQLRKENNEGSAYNIVGFQTNLKFSEQTRVFSLIPGLENIEIQRYGVMHRNTFINAPKVLNETFQLKSDKNIFFAGQLTGVEGYVESIMSGLIAAINLDMQLRNVGNLILPKETIIGTLQRHVSQENMDYEPMNANFGILPQLENPKRDKKERKLQYKERSLEKMDEYLSKLVQAI